MSKNYTTNKRLYSRVGVCLTILLIGFNALGSNNNNFDDLNEKSSFEARNKIVDFHNKFENLYKEFLKGNLEATDELFKIFWNTHANDELALNFCTISARKHDSEGLFELATVIEGRRLGNTIHNPQKALELYHQSAEKNHTGAMIKLARIYYNPTPDGYEVNTQSYKNSLHWYKKAEKRNDVIALKFLGDLYSRDDTNFGTKKEPLKSIDYYKRAIEIDPVKSNKEYYREKVVALETALKNQVKPH